MDRKGYHKKRRDSFRILGICIRCQRSPAEAGRVQCKGCQNTGKAGSRCQRAVRKKQGLCVNGCGNLSVNGKVRCTDCSNAQSEYQKLEYARLKHEIVVAYGGKCTCCKEYIETLLTLDHKLNDGAKERKPSSYNVLTFYRKIVRKGFPEIYQLLCWNCNYGKFRNGGVCPHQKEPV